MLHSPGLSVKTFCWSPTCCHCTRTGPSICLIRPWEHGWGGGRERCLWGFHQYRNFSSFTHLLPGVPFLIYVLRTVWSCLHPERCVEHLMHPLQCTPSQCTAHALLNTVEAVPLSSCAMHKHRHYIGSAFSNNTAQGITCSLSLYKHSKGWCRCTLAVASCRAPSKPWMKNASTNTRVFLLGRRGPLTGYRPSLLCLTVCAMCRGHLGGKQSVILLINSVSSVCALDAVQTKFTSRGK